MCQQLCRACPIQPHLLLPLIWRKQRRPSWSSRGKWLWDSRICCCRKSICTKRTLSTTFTVCHECWIFVSARFHRWNEFTTQLQHISSCRWRIRDNHANRARCEDSRISGDCHEASPAETKEDHWTRYRRQREPSWTMGRRDDKVGPSSRWPSGSSKRLEEGTRKCKQNILFNIILNLTHEVLVTANKFCTHSTSGKGSTVMEIGFLLTVFSFLTGKNFEVMRRRKRVL